MASSGRVYNKAMIAWLTENYPKMMVGELTDAFNKQFGKKKTAQQIKSVLSNRGIKAGVRRSRNPGIYTPEQLEFIEQGYKDLTLRRLTIAVNKKFNTCFTENQIRGCTRNHNFKSGRTGHFEQGQESWNKGKKGLQLGGEAGWFKPGLMPINHRPVGSERVNIYGYVEVKIAEPNVWDLKHRVVWVKHNSPISQDDLVQFKDNNSLNCSIDNLFISTKAINGSMNRTGYCKLTGELKETAVTLTKLKLKTIERT